MLSIFNVSVEIVRSKEVQGKNLSDLSCFLI